MPKTNKFGKSQVLAPQPVPMRMHLIQEPHCKLCKCPHRREADMLLTTGWSQTAVMDWLNTIYGDGAFNKNNISVHARKHMTSQDLAIRDILEERARQIGVDTETAKQTIMTREGAAAAIVQHTFRKMQQGDIDPSVQDMIKALELLNKMDEDASQVIVRELERDMRAFMSAVKKNVPEDMWEDIFLDYERQLQRNPMGILPIGDIEGEVTEDGSE